MSKVEKIKKVLEIAKENGCHCYLYAKDSWTWGYIIFPDETIMYVQCGYFWGYDFGIKYIPSRETGNGCSCHGDNPDSIPTSEITWEKILELKAEGLKFAKKLGAKMYTGFDDWKQNCYCFSKLIQL